MCKSAKEILNFRCTNRCLIFAVLVQRILSNRHIDLSDFSYAALSSIAIATATPHSSALHMRNHPASYTRYLIFAVLVL